MKLVHDWYLIQTAAVDPRARKMKFDDELMGQLIRFVRRTNVQAYLRSQT
jgi:ribosomal protein S18 acetylase RimI-like enzyme